MQLSQLVDTSKRVAETRSRIAKIDHLTAYLRSLSAVEIEIGVAYLIGNLSQGRIGIGYSVIKKALPGGAATNSTLDLVVLAAEWGSGRRQGWLSNPHLGALDPVAKGFVMLGKTFKGMTDEMLAWQTEQLKRLEVATEGHVVHVRPELVVEVAFNEI